MKIPETSANVGAYYGNEENGQWQPNGVIIDSGVGGGVVGSGDAGVHRPPVYPMHMPRPHIPAGYVMAGAFYPPAPFPVAAPQDDFEDYMWMENEEEFDKQVMQQLEEEALMEQCIEAMLEDEQRERARAPHARHNHARPAPHTSSNGQALSLEETVSRSTLNPLAAEFVPTFGRREPPPAEDKPETPPEAAPSTEASPAVTEDTTEHTQSAEENTETHTDVKTEVAEPTTPPTPTAVTEESPDDKRPKDAKKDVKKEAKKPAAKVEVKPKAKPAPVKSEPKVAAKKKDARPARSEPALDATVPTAPTTPTVAANATTVPTVSAVPPAPAEAPKVGNTCL
ncbi:transcriptional regulatory protein AlgP [Ostrinia nubilalis]|uniref:transcriptional regulatory protein AlgP n=1 Tax=Ostrinia nubilalis TaxID=29057 RepID=UPI00308263F7